MANQPKKKHPFRWPWNPSPAPPRATRKASSSKSPKTTAPAPSKLPPKTLSLPISTSPSPLPAPSTKLSPVSSPTPQDEDPMQVEIPIQLSPEDEQKLPPSQRTYEPISPLPTPSPKASPSRQPIDKVPQQPTPPATNSSPGGSRREDPAATTDISPTPSQDVHQPQQPTLTQEVSSQTPTTLQTEMHEKKTEEPKSPTHQQEVLTQELQTTQPPKQVEPDSQLTEPATVPAPELGHTIETMIPTTPLTGQESKAVQEERIAYPDSVANAYTSRVQEKQEMDVEKKEEPETSIHTQANGENVKEEKPTPHQQPLEGRPKHVNGESTTKDLQVTREISHPSQETKITDEKTEEKQPDTQGSKMDLDEKQQTIVDPKIPQASATCGGHDLQTENKDGNKLAQKLIFKHRQLRGSEHGISSITLAGENSGASMHIGRKTLDKARSRRGSKIEEHPSAGSKVNDKALVDTPKMESNEVPSISTSVNSNVQSINNSLILESSCIQEDPGVHLIFSTL